MSDLKPIERFENEKQFSDTKETIERLVREGKLEEQGLDPSEPARFVEMYRSDDGRIWLFAQPDHAFRGYLRVRS